MAGEAILDAFLRFVDGLLGLVGAAALIAGVTVLSRVLGFGRWLVQSSTVGYGTVGSAYASANTLPNVLFEVAAGGALAGALIPVLAGPLARGLRDDVDRILSLSQIPADATVSGHVYDVRTGTLREVVPAE